MARARKHEFPPEVLKRHEFNQPAFLSLPEEERRVKLSAASDAHRQRMAEAQRLRAVRLERARRKGRHSEAQWEAMKALFRHHCVRCVSPSDRLQKDHIRPIYAAGSDSIRNIQPLCPTCNASKGPERLDHRNPAAMALRIALRDLRRLLRSRPA